MPLSPTSSRGTTFNGGTITNPLVVDGHGVGGTLLEAFDTSNPNFDVSVVESIAGANVSAGLVVTAAGTGTASVALSDRVDGAARLSTDQGLRITGQTGLTAGSVLLEVDSEFADVFQVRTDSTHVWAPMLFRAGSPPTLLNTSAPADASLSAGQCALWFDKTNGAAKFMLKGKTTDGTVVSASVAMA